jgi:histidyl-tRNA synthetase
VLAGGRYDGLSKAIGYKSEIPGIGWAAGVDRLANILLDTPSNLLSARDQTLSIGIVTITPGELAPALKL